MAENVTPTPAAQPTPAPVQPLNPQQQAAAVAQQQAQIEKELEAHPRDETIPGGRYKRANDPNWYNSEGQIIDAKGKVQKSDE